MHMKTNIIAILIIASFLVKNQQNSEPFIKEVQMDCRTSLKKLLIGS